MCQLFINNPSFRPDLEKFQNWKKWNSKPCVPRVLKRIWVEIRPRPISKNECRANDQSFLLLQACALYLFINLSWRRHFQNKLYYIHPFSNYFAKINFSNSGKLIKFKEQKIRIQDPPSINPYLSGCPN